MLHSLGVISLLFFVFVAPLQAEDVGSACRGDAKRLCPGSENKEATIVRCLMENEEKLSPECKVAHIEAKSKFLRESPCGNDIKKLCHPPTSGPKLGWMGNCLVENYDKLSQACRDHQKKQADDIAKSKAAPPPQPK